MRYRSITYELPIIFLKKYKFLTCLRTEAEKCGRRSFTNHLVLISMCLAYASIALFLFVVNAYYSFLIYLFRGILISVAVLGVLSTLFSIWPYLFGSRFHSKCFEAKIRRENRRNKRREYIQRF